MRPIGPALVANLDAWHTGAARDSGHVPRYQDLLTKQNTMTTDSRSNVHTYQRFLDHFMIIKTLGGYYRGYNPGVSHGSD